MWSVMDFVGKNLDGILERIRWNVIKDVNRVEVLKNDFRNSKVNYYLIINEEN